MYLLICIATMLLQRLCTAKPVKKGKLSSIAIQRTKVKAASCLLSLHLMGSKILDV